MAKGKGRELTDAQIEIFLGFLAQARDSVGNVTALARVIHTSQASLTKILNRQNGPSYATVRKIAQFLGCSEQDVIGGATPPPDGLVAPPIILQTPRLLACVNFAYPYLHLTART